MVFLRDGKLEAQWQTMFVRVSAIRHVATGAHFCYMRPAMETSQGNTQRESSVVNMHI